MPPFAGQGMCSGIRDAHNLAFKLDLVLRGVAKESLLDTYQEERKPHVTAISKGAIKMGKAIQTQNPLLVIIRNLLFFLARNSAFLQEKIQQDFNKKLPYAHGFLGKHHAMSGQLAIQPLIKVGEEQLLLDDLLGNHLALISTNAISSALSNKFKSRIDGRLYVIDENFTSPELKAWMKAQKMEFVIIRPDRYIYDGGTLKDLERIMNTLFESWIMNKRKQTISEVQ